VEEEEVGEDAKDNDAKAEDAGAGEQQLPAEGEEEAADRHPLPIGQLPHIAEVNPPNYHERNCLAEENIWVYQATR